MNKKFKKIIVFIDCCALILSLTFFVVKFYGYYSNRKTYKNVEKLYIMKPDAKEKQISSQASKKVLPKDEVLKVSDTFEKLLQTNGDTVGWIKIQNTHVNYPVVKYTDNDFYLHNDFEKKSSSAGCIFMDYRNYIHPLDKNIILYGHHMKDESMFRDLVLYKNKDFFYNNDKINFSTIYQEGIWQVFSVYVTDTNFDYLITNFSRDEDYINYINTLKAKSIFKKDISINKEDCILTLSTCSYEFENARTVIHAKYIDNGVIK